MTDDEVLDAVKQTLSNVQMDRPIEAIEQRGQARRRNRGLLGVVAGGGLAAVVALAVALPMAANGSGQDPAGTDPAAAGSTAGSTAVSAPAMEPVAFTVTRQADGSVELTLNYKQVLNPDALQKALAEAGIAAVVKADVLCTPKGKELPETKEVLRVKHVVEPDGSASRYDLVISPAKMPANSVVYFSVFPVQQGGGYAKAAQFLVLKDDPMSCRSLV